MTTSQPQRAREIDLGAVDPHELHASYTGLALSQPRDADPLILWVRSVAPHISVGASQTAAVEVDLDACACAGVPVISRPLGGGTVWIDAAQLCCFLILPAGAAPSRPARLFELALEPMVQAMRQLGLAARRVGDQDIWVGDRKIQGSGAATIGSTGVLGTSFLRRFDWRRFAALVRCPSEAYRQWLLTELAAGMTDWEREGVEVTDQALRTTVRNALEARLEWRVEPSRIAVDERRDIARARDELNGSPDLGARRLVADGIKINRHTYLLERSRDGLLLRLVVRGDRIQRVYCSRAELRDPLERTVGEPVDSLRLRTSLASSGLPRREAEDLARTIIDMCSDLGS